VHDDGTRLIWFVSESEESLTVTPRLRAGSLRDDGREVGEVSLEPFGVSILTLHV